MDTHSPALDGRLVRLRAREQADLSRLNEMFNDPDVLAGLTFPFPQSMAGIREWAERTRADRTNATFVIETLQGRDTIGVCSLENIDPRARASVFGIWVGKPFWNEGYGTDATRTCCRFGFRYLNLQRIELTVYAETNPRAVRAYEKVGFKHEGTLRRAQFIGGRYRDVAVMGLLAEELIEAE
jgi:RimJ/RimL family protein N-acetyltransferase